MESPSWLECFAEVPSTFLCNGAIIHIGVVSDVVCSLLGNSRVSDRGTENRIISRFFLCPRRSSV